MTRQFKKVLCPIDFSDDSFTALDYADSSGSGMLVSCLTNVKKAGGELKLAGANPRIRRIFAMTGVDCGA